MDAIAGDDDVTTFDPITSIILKWLRFKCVRWMHYLYDSALLNSGWDCLALLGFHGYSNALFS
jgi:hypothetical protein